VNSFLAENGIGDGISVSDCATTDDSGKTIGVIRTVTYRAWVRTYWLCPPSMPLPTRAGGRSAWINDRECEVFLGWEKPTRHEKVVRTLRRTAGVAWGAYWIACNAIGQSIVYGS
jgi:hypothetical protein